MLLMGLLHKSVHIPKSGLVCGTSNECAELLTSAVLVVQWGALERDSNEDGMHQDF